jgi:hypothetical protein
MRKAQIAEWILALFTSREQAAATVGDCLEEVPARGALWFWSSVLCTGFSFIWRDISSDPPYITGLVFRAWLLLNVIFPLVAMICLGVLGDSLGLIPHPPSKIVSAATEVFAILVQFQAGRWIARRARERAIAACLALGLISIIIPLILNALLQWRFHPVLMTGFFWTLPLSVLPVIAGAIWVRRRESFSIKVI